MIDRFSVRTLHTDEIKTLYKERLTRDFPPNELKPLSMITKALEEDEYICYGAVAGETILAYAFFVKCGANALVDYYAVKEDMRDAGIGSRFIRELIAGPLQGMNCVLLEAEDPDCAQDMHERETRNRRLSFYTRNGLWTTAVKAEVWGAPYCILQLPIGVRHSSDTIAAVYSAIYHAMMTDKVYNERVRIAAPCPGTGPLVP